MAWDAPALVSAGEVIEVSWGNAVRNSLFESAAAKAQAAGDLFVGTGANALKRLALGSAGQVPVVNNAGNDVIWSPNVSAESNLIINGDFNSWQEGTSFAAPGTNTFVADLFNYQKIGTMAHVIERVTTVPTVAQSGHKSNYALSAKITTEDTVLGAGDLSFFQYRIEGFDFLKIAQRAFTIGFWHAHTKTGTYCVAFRNSGNDRTYVAEYTQSVSNAEEYSTVTVPASPSAGTWDYTTGVGLRVIWTMASGTTFHTTANAWNTGDFLATANQVNACDAVDNIFKISQLMLVPGEVAVPFVGRSHQREMDMISRYTYAVEANGGATADDDYSENIMGPILHPVLMRATPTITIVSGALIGHHATAPAALDVDQKGLAFKWSGAAYRTIGAHGRVLYRADARL